MMIKYGLHKCLQFGLTGLLGCLSLSVSTAKTQAQQSNIVPDNTLGAESSQVIDNFQGLPIEVITGGATRGINLFHSFQEFNVSEGRGAYFSTPNADIQNILARVTGNNPSEILGKLGILSISSPNLFLINPNGIVFGENASLDVEGSFVGTTANGVQFGNQGIFSATNPQTVPLLTINPSVLLFNQIQANGGIINQSQAPANINPIGEKVRGLRVADGKSLLLVGGNINIDGGGILAYGGNVELAGLAAPGNVGLNIAGDNLGLVIPENVERADVSLSNGAEVNVRGAGGGNIKIQARNVNLAGESKLRAGIATGLGTRNSQGGDITINATGDTTLIDESFIANVVQERAFGNAGDINITTGTLTLSNTGQINASLLGEGNAGNVNINVQGDISFRTLKPDEFNGIMSEVGEGAIGNGANVTINTNSLEINDTSEIQGSTRGKGNSGNIIINARNNISLDGSIGNFSSRIINDVQLTGEGNAGNIQITTGTLNVTNGAFISSSISGTGNAGNISINALNNITFDSNSSVITNVFAEGIGNGANIYLKTGSLSLTNGGRVLTSVLGKGNAGNITVEASDNVRLDGFFVNVDSNPFSGLQSDLLIGGVGKAGNIQVTTGSLSVTNGAQISSTTAGVENAGNITINARDNVTISGFGGREKFGSLVSTGGIQNGIGNGGDIRITASNLLLKDGGQLSASNGGQGNAGNIFLDVGNTITFDGIGGNGLRSSADTQAFDGNGGNIQIETGSLFLTNGGAISSPFTGVRGNSGNITINARDSVRIDGVIKGVTFSTGQILDVRSNIGSSLLSGEGKAGDIEITTGSLSVTNGATIFGFTDGQGNGGNITINARDTVTIDGGENGLFTSVGTSALDNSTGNAGDIRINARELFLKNGGILSAFSSGQGNGGNIFIDTRDAVIIDGSTANNLTGVLTNLFASGIGRGGDIQITTNSLTLSNGGIVNASTDSRGNAGNITIDARDRILIDGVGRTGFASGIFSTVNSTAVGNGGNINLTAGSLFLTNGGIVTASTDSRGDAGNITIDARDRILIDGVDTTGFASGIFSTVNSTAVGNGGNINLTAGSLFLTNGGIVTASTDSRGDAGNITIDARDRILIDGASTRGFSSGVFSTVNPTAVGNGGNINLTAGSLFLTNGGTVGASTFSRGDAGDITIDARDRILIDGVSTTGFSSGVFSTVDPTAVGNGGNINLTAGSLFLTNGGIVNASTSSRGNAGNITIDARDRIVIDGVSTTGFSSGVFSAVNPTAVGNGGNINLTAGSLFLSNVGRVSTSSLGQGKAGDININSGSTTLDNQGFIGAITNSDDGGNINLTVNDLLLLRGGSVISTTAGRAQLGGNGGNININSRFIIAIPEENNDITANAFTGTGGNVEINSQGVFGIESRKKPTKKSDITASSELGVSGVVNINVPDTSSIQNSFTELSPVIDTNALIANSCISRGTKRQENSFTITGSGALTTNRPGEVLVSNYTTGDVRGVETPSRPWKKGDAIIEPQGLYRLNNGQLLLSRECSN